jgi:hypothetical protein
MDTDLDTTLTDTSQQQVQQVQQQQQQQAQQVQQQQQQVAQGGGQGMETDELIPTLPELSTDVFNTIFSANPVVENELTWL